MTQSYQSLVASYPRFSLATFPTPLQRAERLETSLRRDGCKSVPRLYLKRDDLLSLALGGNKTRNLEFLIGAALERGATDVITAGRQQSNHCRLTAAACAKAGLRAHLVVSGTEPEWYAGNLLLDRLLGAEIRFTGSDDRNVRATLMREIETTIESAGRIPYTIPVGGSDARGAVGHVLAADELLRQCQIAGETEFTVVLATATGGTQAGLIVGFLGLRVDAPVVGLAVAKSVAELTTEVRSIVASLAVELGIPETEADLVTVDGRALGAGYGVATPDGQRAIERLAQIEGVLADPIYTGKGLVGLFSMIAEERFAATDAVVFVHTGGSPALFA